MRSRVLKLMVGTALLCTIFVSSAAQATGEFLIIISKPLFDTGLITPGLDAYENGLAAEGYNTERVYVSADPGNLINPAASLISSEADLKNLIKGFSEQPVGLLGFVFIGSAPDIPDVYWYNYPDFEYETPTDVYYADLDDWEPNRGQAEVDGVIRDVFYTYDGEGGNNLNPGNPVFKPDIIYSRIDCKKNSDNINDEAGKINAYLLKVSQYRAAGYVSPIHTSEENDTVIYFRDDDFAIGAQAFNKIPANHSAGSIESYRDFELTTTFKLKELIERKVKVLHITNHSSPNTFGTEEWESNKFINAELAAGDLKDAEPKALIIDMYSCGAANFTKENLGAALLFGSGYTYNILGFTAVHNRFTSEIFYQELNEDKTVGQAFLKFYQTVIETGFEYNIADNFIDMTRHILLGDPLLKYSNPGTGTAPYVSTDLSSLQADCLEHQLFHFSVYDADADLEEVTLVLKDQQGLPENSFFDESTNTLNWMPTYDQADKDFFFILTATDAVGNKYTEEFSIFVNRINNSCFRDESIWTTSGEGIFFLNNIPSPELAEKLYFPPQMVKMFMECDNNTLSLHQRIEVEPHKQYKLSGYVLNMLTMNPGEVSISFDELGAKLPVRPPLPYEPGGKEFTYFSFIVGSGDYYVLNMNLNAGVESDGQNTEIPVSGELVFNCLRLEELDEVYEPGDSVYLSDVFPSGIEQDFGPVEIDQSFGLFQYNDGQPITINGTVYEKGLGVLADSEIVYELNRQYFRFKTDVGVDETAMPGNSMEFQVWLDGVPVYSSGPMEFDDPAKSVNLDVSGVETMVLKLIDTGDGTFYNFGDWANAHLVVSLDEPLLFDYDVYCEYYTTDSDPVDDVLASSIRFYNNDNKSFNLEGLTICYWFTDEINDKTSLITRARLRLGVDTVNLDIINKTNITLSEVTGYSSANYKQTIGFLPGAGALNPNGGRVSVVSILQAGDGNTFDESDDYSYGGFTDDYVEWDRITVYYYGILIWGTEPPAI